MARRSLASLALGSSKWLLVEALPLQCSLGFNSSETLFNVLICVWIFLTLFRERVNFCWNPKWTRVEPTKPVFKATAQRMIHQAKCKLPNQTGERETTKSNVRVVCTLALGRLRCQVASICTIEMFSALVTAHIQLIENLADNTLLRPRHGDTWWFLTQSPRSNLSGSETHCVTRTKDRAQKTEQDKTKADNRRMIWPRSANTTT